MATDVDTLRQAVMEQAQGALRLNIAYIGVVNSLFDALAASPLTVDALAEIAGRDPGYVRRWCDAAYAFDLLNETPAGAFALTPLGAAFNPKAPGTLMPFAVQSVLSAHMAERAAGLMTTGERPGERVLAERETLLAWFGPMLEQQFGPLFERQVLPAVPAFAQVDRHSGLAVDLGCGNGWYLRALLRNLPHLRGLGLDGFDENIRQATTLADAQGLGERLRFEVGDIYHFATEERADLIAMNRALHHVWDQKEVVLKILREHLNPGGVVVIWEPCWPAQRAALRAPAHRGMAFQNLAEHVQGNHFLRPEEIVEAFEAVGMSAEVFRLLDEREAVIVGRMSR